MDPGLFESSRTRLWCWLLAPIALIAAVYVPADVFFRQTRQTMEEQAGTLALVPDMERKLHGATDLLNAFRVFEADSSRIADALSQRVNHAARQADFAIRSLSVEKNGTAGANGPGVFQIALQGEGSIAAFVALFQDLQTPEMLLTIQTAKIRMAKMPPDPVYGGDFVLTFHPVEL